ncbi:sodium- and chloride-dependent taurine transporter-like isoform X2 [Pecten maximus]|nr:sodium- and chloride-dependent taurine transporter-like isoform X2 [Pecten maximus]
MVILTYYNIYYMLILAWGGYYMVMSMQAVLPWTHCNNAWNTDRCRVSKESTIATCLSKLNVSQDVYNVSRLMCLDGNSSDPLPVDPTVEFWERGVIQMSSGIEESGGVVWQIALSLLIVWIIIYFCVWRGVKWSGKVVYFTAVFPYVVLTCLLVRGLTLDGAVDGIIYFLIPDFNRLADVQVWIDGGTQIFFSLAVAFGGLMTLGSYKKFNDNFYRDSIVIMCINSGTSILGGFAVFSVLGFMAREQGVDISDISTSGTALAFLTYPKAVSLMPGASFWAVLFFFMLFLVGMDSLFLGVEVAVTMMVDALPVRYQKSRSRMVLTAVYCFVLFLVGLSMTTRGGIYIWILFDNFSASGMVLLWVCFWECIAIGWVFGADRFDDILYTMLGFKINRLFWICLKFITPIMTTALFISQLTSLRLNNLGSSYSYPPLAQAFGLMLSLSSMVCVPIVMVYKLMGISGSLVERLKILTTPIIEESRIPSSWDLKTSSVIKIPQDKKEEEHQML